MQGRTSEVYPEEAKVLSIYYVAVDSTKITAYEVVCKKYGIHCSPKSHQVFVTSPQFF